MALGLDPIRAGSVEEYSQKNNSFRKLELHIKGYNALSDLAKNAFDQVPYVADSRHRRGNQRPMAAEQKERSAADLWHEDQEWGRDRVGNLFEPRAPVSVASWMPRKLGDGSVKWPFSLAKHAQTIEKVRIAAGGAVLYCSGFGWLAAGMAAPGVLKTFGTAGLIPEKVRGTLETTISPLVKASAEMYNTMLSPALSLLYSLGGEIGLGGCVQEIIDQKLMENLKLEGPALAEIDAHWRRPPDLSYEEIIHILNEHENQNYTMNPAHFSKQVHLTADLPKNSHFASFLTLFHKVDWGTEEQYRILILKFKDDERFLSLLLETSFEDDVELANRMEIFDQSLEQLAQCEKKTKGNYLEGELLRRMERLVETLCCQTPDSSQELLDTQEACSYILPYLLNKLAKGQDARAVAEAAEAAEAQEEAVSAFDSRQDQVEFEDILRKLAVEGGDYCLRGIKRAAMEILYGNVVQGSEASKDPLVNYELRICQRLQSLRDRIMQNLYQKMIEAMTLIAEGRREPLDMKCQTTHLPSVVAAQDVNTLKMYRKSLSLGFCALTEHERNAFGPFDFYAWSLFRPIRNEMYKMYQASMEQVITEEGEVYFIEYMVAKIQSLNLKKEQKDSLIRRLQQPDDGSSLEEFHYLFFMMIGVLKGGAPIDLGWEEIPGQSAEGMGEGWDE